MLGSRQSHTRGIKGQISLTDNLQKYTLNLVVISLFLGTGYTQLMNMKGRKGTNYE